MTLENEFIDVWVSKGVYNNNEEIGRRRIKGFNMYIAPDSQVTYRIYYGNHGNVEA
jgi:hypothetical protein